MGRPRKNPIKTEAPAVDQSVPVANPVATLGSELANAILQGIESARPKQITVANRTPKTPWSPKAGEKQSLLKRKMYQHGMPLIDKLTNTEIDLLNKLKPGVYCDGWVTVNRLKNKGLNIDYKLKSGTQKQKLVSQFGIRSFKELLERIVAEQEQPQLYKTQEELD